MTVDEIGMELAMDMENSNSMIKTLEPFHLMSDGKQGQDYVNESATDVEETSHQISNQEPKKKQRKAKYIPDPTITLFENIFGPDNWSRFLVLETETQISNIKLEKLLL